MRFIGDIHGKYLPYIKRARKSPDGHSIQVGDFGVGFGNDKVPNFEPHGLDPKKHRFIRGNHDRYIIEKLWEEELPTLEGMNPYDPICRAIVENEKWTAEKIGDRGIEFIRKMLVSHREIIN